MPQLVIILLSLILFSACDTDIDPYRNISYNANATACGIYQPMNGVDWLRKYDSEMSYLVANRNTEDYFDTHITVYRCDSTGNDAIVQFTNTWYSNVVFYSCDGQFIAGGEWTNPHSDFSYRQNLPDGYKPHQPEPCRECDSLFKKYRFVDYVARYEYKPKK